VGNFAFYGCPNLTTVRIPDSVTTIGEYAFAECTGLRTLDLGSGLTAIGTSAFQQCEALTAVRFPASLATIGTKAFYRCYAISAVTIPETVTSMGVSAFAYCTSLVRASVQAPLDTLPNWTFYGCSALADVSLASTITTTGEYAFQGCDNLGAVYAQTDDLTVADQIQQTIAAENEHFSNNGYVATYQMPDTSIVTVSDQENFTQTQVTQTDNATITVTEQAEQTTSAASQTTITATIETDDGWAELKDILTTTAQRTGNITAQVQLAGEEVSGENLAQLSGVSATVSVITNTGATWKIDLSQLDSDSLSDSYTLGMTVTETDQTDIQSDQVYQLAFAGSTNFNAAVAVQLTSAAAYQNATLYQKVSGSLEAVQTVVVDAEGKAWFNLASVDDNTEYYVALNVEDLADDSVVIPETLYEDYGAEDLVYLTDEDGVTYEVTGRTSSWGITGQRFAIYVGIAVAVIVLIVSVTMITINQFRKSKEKYAIHKE
jgi:hypothetical protein